jgi:hypothetical protein
MKVVFTVIPIIMGLIWIGCKEPQPLEGETSYSSELSFDTLYAVQDTFLVKGRTSTAGSPKLLIGRYAGYHTRSLLHFQNLPDDTIDIDSLYLRLHSWSNYGESGEAITGKVHIINEEWPESINETGEISTTPLDAAPFYVTGDSVSFKIDLPPSLMNTWRDTTGGNNNFGLMLDFESAAFIKEFYSGNTVYAPELIWTTRYAASDSVIRDTTYTTLDAALIDFIGEWNPEALYIASGYLVHTFIKFDFTQLPQNSNIVYVNFKFANNDAYSAINANKTNSFYLKNVLTSFENLSYDEEIVLDESVTEDLFLLMDQAFSFLTRDYDQLVKSDYGRYYLQDIVNGSIEHDSFMIVYTNQYNDASIYAIKGKNAGGEAPQIIVGYNRLIPPKL